MNLSWAVLDAIRHALSQNQRIELVSAILWDLKCDPLKLSDLLPCELSSDPFITWRRSLRVIQGIHDGIRLLASLNCSGNVRTAIKDEEDHHEITAHPTSIYIPSIVSYP